MNSLSITTPERSNKNGQWPFRQQCGCGFLTTFLTSLWPQPTRPVCRTSRRAISPEPVPASCQPRPHMGALRIHFGMSSLQGPASPRAMVSPARRGESGDKGQRKISFSRKGETKSCPLLKAELRDYVIKRSVDLHSCLLQPLSSELFLSSASSTVRVKACILLILFVSGHPGDFLNSP